MSTRVSLIALGVGAYIAFAIATFPASVAHRWFAPEGLALALVEGSVWRGSAGHGGIDGFAFSDLRWQLHPGALLTGRLSLTAQARLADGLLRSGIVLSAGRVRVTDLALGTSLATVEAFLPVTGVSGNLSAQMDELELVDGWPVNASGTVRVSNLMAPPLFPVPGVTTIPLGNYQARITTEPDGIVAAVSDEGGPLELDGRASLSPARAYTLEARITPRRDAVNVLVEGLKFMDPDSRNGQYSIRYEGQL